MTIPTKALAKQQKLVNNLLNDLVKRFKGLREIIATLKKQLNKVFKQEIKRVSSLYNVIKKKSLTESLLEASNDNNELNQTDVSMINKIGKVMKPVLKALFRPFAIGTKTLKSLAAPKPIIVITIYALLWTYAVTIINKLLVTFSIGKTDTMRKKVSMYIGSILVRPALEMTMRSISFKQKNEIDRDLYLKALTLVKLGNMTYTKFKLSKFSLFKVGTTNLALDVITNELQIKYGNKPAVWLIGGLLSVSGNLLYGKSVLNAESMYNELGLSKNIDIDFFYKVLHKINDIFEYKK